MKPKPHLLCHVGSSIGTLKFPTDLAKQASFQSVPTEMKCQPPALLPAKRAGHTPKPAPAAPPPKQQHCIQRPHEVAMLVGSSPPAACHDRSNAAQQAQGPVPSRRQQSRGSQPQHPHWPRLALSHLRVQCCSYELSAIHMRIGQLATLPGAKAGLLGGICVAWTHRL